MSRFLQWVIYGVAIIATATSIVVVSSVQVDAAGLSYTVTVNGLKNQTDNNNYLHSQCVNTNLLTSVAAFPSNIVFNENTGGINYTSNLSWKQCGRGNTRSVAITGYPNEANGGLATCPNAGWYRGGDLATYDCIKYTMSDGGHMTGYSRLGCSAGYNYACVNGGSNPAGVFRSQVELRELQPPNYPVSRSYGGLTGSIPNWTNLKNTSGSFTFYRPGAYCMWFKYNDDSSNASWLHGTSGGGGCADMSITVSWTVDYNLVPTVSAGPVQVYPGSTVSVGMSVANSGMNAPASTRWQLSRYTLAPGASDPRAGGGTTAAGVLPTAYLGAGSISVAAGNRAFNTGTTTFPNTNNTAPVLAVGSRICYILSVQPYSIASGMWRHSPSRCVTIIPHFDLFPVVGISSNRVVPGGSLTANTPSVRNDGLTTSANAQWRLSFFRVNAGIPIPRAGGGTSAQAASIGSYLGSTAQALNDNVASGSRQFNRGVNALASSTQSVGDFSVGTKFCFMLSVQPRAHSSTEWRHSAPVCAVVARTPKVQVRGGDLVVGRSAGPSTSAIITSVVNQSSGKYFGSWSEYAIAAPGAISGMASGAGYVGGSATDQLCMTDLSLLTFSNNSAASSVCVGGYAVQGTSAGAAMAQFFGRATPSATSSGNAAINTLTANTVHKYSGTGALTVSSTGQVPVGKWVVIYAPQKTVTISSDINYANGAVSSAKNAPQVVIVANQIIINDNVRNVDAWLVTQGASNFIATCSSAAASLTSQVCSDALRVNGPVVTSSLHLRRTYGGETEALAGFAAEVFNFRPDAYMWLLENFSGSQKLPTTSVKDLPPRF